MLVFIPTGEEVRVIEQKYRIIKDYCTTSKPISCYPEYRDFLGYKVRFADGAIIEVTPDKVKLDLKKTDKEIQSERIQ